MHGALVIRGVVVVWARISCLLAITPSHFSEFVQSIVTLYMHVSDAQAGTDIPFRTGQCLSYPLPSLYRSPSSPGNHSTGHIY